MPGDLKRFWQEHTKGGRCTSGNIPKGMEVVQEYKRQRPVRT